jgi:hypothetical protein
MRAYGLLIALLVVRGKNAKSSSPRTCPRSILLALLALSPACNRDLPTLADILSEFEAKVALPIALCDGGLVDCVETSTTSLEFMAARACLFDAWQECRPTHFDYQAVESQDSVVIRDLYILPTQGRCGITLFEFKLPTQPKKNPILSHFDCETLAVAEACGGFDLQGCSLVETIEFAQEHSVE